jgi:arylsulfatase A-like enzyme
MSKQFAMTASGDISRRRMLRMVAGSAGSVVFMRRASAVEPNARPNVIFILADDLGWSDTALYGGDLVETPNLARLAKTSVQFTNAYSAAPVCSPTRASFMTGKYPARLHMTTWYEASQKPPMNKKLIPPVTVGDLPLTETTVAEVLHEAGYLTAHVGKWHLGSAGFYPENQGFDINIGGTFWGAPQTHFYPYKGTKYFGSEARYIPHLEWGKPGEYLADRLTTEALDIMSKAREQPFYLNLWFHSVHVPAEAPESLVESYKQKLHPGLHHTNATYAAMVGNLDTNIGRVLDHIEKLGIADRTIVVFGSDNGGYIGKWQGARVTDNYPLRSGKGSLYEGGIRVPLMVRWPGTGAQGKSSEEPVISNDFFPTVLDMAGLLGDASYERTDSRSLLPLLKDPHGRLDRERLFFHYPHYYETTTPVSAVRERNWKLLQYLEDERCELYNLTNDLSERNDLASRQPERAAQLREQLESWRNAVNAQMPSRNPKVAFTDRQHRWDKADQELALMD